MRIVARVVLGFCLWFVYTPAIAAEQLAISDAHISSANLLGADIADWILEMSPHPNSIAIFDVRQKLPLTSHFSTLLENEILQNLQRDSTIKTMTCFPCRSARASVVGDQVVVSKGSPTMEEFKKMAQELGVESFLLVESNRFTLSTVASVQLYSGAGHLIANRNFTEQVVDLDGSSAMLGFTVTVGAGLGGKSNGDPSGAADAFLLQDLGNGRKGGLVIGGFAGNGGGGGYAIPTLAWTQRKSLFNLRGIAMLGVGPGASNKGYGFAVRGAYQLFLGYCLFGIEAAGLVPLESKSGKESADAVVGLSIGIVFGR
jgi:hypothetical protein